MIMSEKIDEFEKIRYDEDKSEKRLELLQSMSNEEIDILIKSTPIPQGKIALAKFKK